MNDIEVRKVDPHKAEQTIGTFRTFSARTVTIDGHQMLVMIYGNGPTPHINTIERAIDAMPIVRVSMTGETVSVAISGAAK
jgi:hypothetical protein